jgi:hypothetical protein
MARWRSVTLRKMKAPIPMTKNWLYRIVLGALLLVTAAGQVRVWASDRGLWNDEIYVTNNLLFRTLRGLTGPLLYLQVAPPGWLAGEKAILKMFGPDEQVLKLPSVIAAITVLALTAYAAQQATGRWGSLVAVGLLGTSHLLYYYAGELKQYAFEAALAMVIIVAAGAYGKVATGPTPVSRRRVLAFAGITTVASMGSYSALVVLAGAAAGIGVLQAAQRRWRALAVTALAATPGLLVGVGQAAMRWRLGFMRGQHDFFPHGFPPQDAGPIDILRWLPEMWQGFVASPLGWRYPLVVLVLVVAGLACLAARGRPLWAAMLGGVFLAAIGAAAFRGFPFEGRVALYLIAPMAIAVAAAIAAAVDAVVAGVRQAGGRRMLRPALAALLAVVATAALALAVRPSAVNAYHQVTQPRYRDDGRDMLREVVAQLRPGDVVVAYYFSEPLLTWYGRQYKLPTVGLAVLQPAEACDSATVELRLTGATRVWYVHGAKLSRHPDDYQQRVVDHLATHGAVVARSSGFRASGWALVDLTAEPDAGSVPAFADSTYACLAIGRLPRR